jgi:hypothetical protein
MRFVKFGGICGNDALKCREKTRASLNQTS